MKHIIKCSWSHTWVLAGPVLRIRVPCSSSKKRELPLRPSIALTKLGIRLTKGLNLMQWVNN
ncbi:hypothetical protein HanRHA438_Chr14g0648921 [Helianthus annuus]|nr:hypothetical protein HanRHA438_Chr14g0648921 [Helianthus annuus]